MDKAIQIGEQFGVDRLQSSCDYSYLIKVKNAITEVQGSFDDLAYIQKMIDVLEGFDDRQG